MPATLADAYVPTPRDFVYSTTPLPEQVGRYRITPASEAGRAYLARMFGMPAVSFCVDDLVNAYTMLRDEGLTLGKDPEELRAFLRHIPA